MRASLAHASFYVSYSFYVAAVKTKLRSIFYFLTSVLPLSKTYEKPIACMCSACIGDALFISFANHRTVNANSGEGVAAVVGLLIIIVIG